MHMDYINLNFLEISRCISATVLDTARVTRTLIGTHINLDMPEATLNGHFSHLKFF